MPPRSARAWSCAARTARTWRSAGCWASLLLAACCWPARAGAESRGLDASAGSVARTQGNVAAAEALFEEGVALLDRGQYSRACVKLEASLSLDVGVGTLLYLADCYERMGRLASAWARFREASSLARQQAMTERERIAERRAAALRPKLAQLTLRLPEDAPPGTIVRLGETLVPRASWGSAFPVDAGVLTLEVTAPASEPFRKRVLIPGTPAARVSVNVPSLEPSSSEGLRRAPARKVAGSRPPLPAAASDEDTGDGWRIMGVTLSSVGALGLAGGGVLTLVATQRNDESLEHCRSDPGLCSARGVELRSQAARYADLATVSTAVGASLLVGGVLIYVSAPSAPAQERSSGQRKPERLALQLAPDLAHRGLAFEAGGSW